MGILIFKGLTERRFYKSFGVKGLIGRASVRLTKHGAAWSYNFRETQERLTEFQNVCQNMLYEYSDLTLSALSAQNPYAGMDRKLVFASCPVFPTGPAGQITKQHPILLLLRTVPCY
jgi:hypothetical protein